jgi:hypothetical protein
MRFLRPLLGVIRFDHQRNPDIRNKLKVYNIVVDVKVYKRKWLDNVERMNRSRLPKLAFQYEPRRRWDVGRPRRRWRDQEHFEL